MSDAQLNDGLTAMRDQLRRLAICLKSLNILDDASSIFGVLDTLKDLKPKKGVLSWNYSLLKSQLKLESLHVRWPGSPSAFICIFDITIGGKIYSSPSSGSTLTKVSKKGVPKTQQNPVKKIWAEYLHPDDNSCWAIDSLAVDLQLIAHSAGASQWQQFWHFDRHITSGTQTTDDQPLEIHPLFHFHFGGDGLANGRANNSAEWGSLLELYAPRIAHPPLDLVLLIDFILSNFAGRTWKNLVDNHQEYQEIVEAAQRRFWCPYKRTLNDFFVAPNPQRKNHSARDLWPSLAHVAN